MRSEQEAATGTQRTTHITLGYFALKGSTGIGLVMVTAGQERESTSTRKEKDEGRQQPERCRIDATPVAFEECEHRYSKRFKTFNATLGDYFYNFQREEKGRVRQRENESVKSNVHPRPCQSHAAEWQRYT